MGSFFYVKLAISNIKKNGKFYIPYLITCVSMAAMFYMMCFISMHSKLSKMFGGESLTEIMMFGNIIVGLFAVIVLLYTNSFLIKRRKKEFGLFNILGMEKRHIAKVLIIENIIIAIGTIILGIVIGILFSKLLLLLLCKILKITVIMGFEINVKGIVTTCILFFAIFFVTLLSNLIRIKISNPIELLRGGNVGEKEPKIKWLLVIIGVLALGAGYFIAITTESPLNALFLFFVAVVLVIIGTFCLFTAISIAVLKMLKKNKKFYYQTKHFTTVSGMIYRMKQNASGLANICILSTAVLITVSTTVALYLGMDNLLSNRFTRDIAMNLNGADNKTIQSYTDIAKNIVKKHNLDTKKCYSYRYISFTAHINDNKLEFNTGNVVSASAADGCFVLMTLDEYNRITDKNMELKENEVLAYSSAEKLAENFVLCDRNLTVKEVVDDFPINGEFTAWLANFHCLVVDSTATFDNITKQQKAAYGKTASIPTGYIGMDLTGSDEEIIDCANEIRTNVTDKYIKDNEGKNLGNKLSVDGHAAYFENKQSFKSEFYRLYGGFLFLGLFLGALFLMATVLIIYYKQITEGYDDKERFEIMKKVGMSYSEIKTTIREQVLMVFFLPIITAGIHILAASGMIKKMLEVLNLTDTAILVKSTIGTIIVFCIFYGIVYSLTARVYYKIVS